MEQEAERDLRQPGVDLVEAARAGVIDPAVPAEQPRREDGAQRGDVDDVLEQVLVGSHHVGEVEGHLRGAVDLERDELRHLVELVDRLVRQAAAAGQRLCGVAQRRLDRAHRAVLGLGREGALRHDALAEVVLDVDRCRAGRRGSGR